MHTKSIKQGKCWGNEEFPSTVSLCGRRKRGWWRWLSGGGESLRSKCHSAILSFWGGREGCREKGQPMCLHKATCGKSYVEGPWSLSLMFLLAWRCVVMDYNTHHWWICLKWEIFFDLQGQYAFTLTYVSVFPLYLRNTVSTNRENREKVREKHHKRERKHNSRALLNKKSVAINSKPSSWPQHCFRFRRPGFSLPFSALMVIAQQNQTHHPPQRLFLLFFFVHSAQICLVLHMGCLYNYCLFVYVFTNLLP